MRSPLQPPASNSRGDKDLWQPFFGGGRPEKHNVFRASTCERVRRLPARLWYLLGLSNWRSSHWTLHSIPASSFSSFSFLWRERPDGQTSEDTENGRMISHKAALGPESLLLWCFYHEAATASLYFKWQQLQALKNHSDQLLIWFIMIMTF